MERRRQTIAVRAGELRELLEVWKAEPETDENHETDYVPRKLRTIWANVTPTSGRTAELPGETERAEITHKVTIRAPSLPEICREMYFVVRGQRLDVLYWYPVYNRRGWMEIFCRLTQGEVPADGNG